MAAKTRKEKEPTFEEAITQLEAIIDRIETGQIELEESLTFYEQGLKLVKRCRTVLEQAEKRVATLAVDANGALKVKEEPGPPSIEPD